MGCVGHFLGCLQNVRCGWQRGSKRSNPHRCALQAEERGPGENVMMVLDVLGEKEEGTLGGEVLARVCVY